MSVSGESVFWTYESLATSQNPRMLLSKREKIFPEIRRILLCVFVKSRLNRLVCFALERFLSAAL